jgi:hypothetical protein
MNQPRPSIVRFATAVIASESGSGGGSVNSAAVAGLIVAKLRAGLGKLVGELGFDVMLARALVLARRVDSHLVGVSVGPGGSVSGFDQGDREATERAAVALLSHFVELVAVLVGEDLAMRLVQSLWPEVDVREEIER